MAQEHAFIDFWHKYAPMAEFKNRYRACEKMWNTFDEQKRRLIMLGLEKECTDRSPPVRKKNPYFYLLDWQPPQPQWLTPAETGHLLAEHIPLAVCRNPETQRFGTVTREEADLFALEVHHYM